MLLISGCGCVCVCAGRCQQDGREVDHPAEEGPGITLLGEPDPGHAGGAVHGGGGDLWCCCVRALPGTHRHTHTQTCMYCGGATDLCNLYCLSALPFVVCDSHYDLKEKTFNVNVIYKYKCYMYIYIYIYDIFSIKD